MAHLRDGCVWLHGVVVHHRKGEDIFKNLVGLAKAFIDVAASKMKMVANIGPRYRTPIGQVAEVAGWPQGFMQQGRVKCGSLIQRCHGRQFLHIDVEQRHRRCRFSLAVPLPPPLARQRSARARWPGWVGPDRPDKVAVAVGKVVGGGDPHARGRGGCEVSIARKHACGSGLRHSLV